WSQILSGWPSVTDSDVNRSRGEVMKLVVIRRLLRMKTAPAHEKGQCPGQRPPSHLPEPTFCRSWHHVLGIMIPRDRLPRLQRAGPSASLGKSAVKGLSCAAMLPCGAGRVKPVVCG